MCFLQRAWCYLGVDLRGAEAGVAQQLLDLAEIGAAGEHVGGGRVAQAVRLHVLAGGFHDLPDALARDAPALVGEEQGPRVGVAFLEQERPREAEIVLYRDDGRFAEGDDALLASLPEDAGGFAFEFDIALGDVAELGDADGAAVENFEDGIVAELVDAGLLGRGAIAGGVDDLFHGAQLHGVRQEFFELRILGEAHGVFVEALMCDEPFVEGAERGDFTRARTFADVVFGEVLEEEGDVGGVSGEEDDIAFAEDFGELGEVGDVSEDGVLSEAALGVEVEGELLEELRIPTARGGES